MISQANNMALDPIQIALAKPLDDFVAAIDSAYKKYRPNVGYATQSSRVYPIVLDENHELKSMTNLERKARLGAGQADLPIVAYLEITACHRLMSKEVGITVLLYDNSKEPTLMDRLVGRLSVHVAVTDEDMRIRGCGFKLTGDNAIAAIRRVLWEGAA